jgi:hypothetical protein
MPGKIITQFLARPSSKACRTALAKKISYFQKVKGPNMRFLGWRL